MADPLWGQQMTNMWMLDPYMFDPTQKSNDFSDYNGVKLQAQNPSYNTGAGGPTNAMGQPIPAFQAWQTANPAGMNINNTPAQPQVAPPQQQQQMTPQDVVARLGGGANAQGAGEYYGNWLAAQAKLTPQQQQIQAQNRAMNANAMLFNNQGYQGPGTTPGARNYPLEQQLQGYAMGMGQPQGQGQQTPMAAAPAQTGGAPNNWMAALNALSQPGNPVTRGANVPMAQGFQPSGGINTAFLGQAGGLGNRNFLSALGALQGRKQQV